MQIRAALRTGVSANDLAEVFLHTAVYAGVPTMHIALLSTPGVESMDLSSLKFCWSGGAPLPLAVLVDRP